MPWRGIPLGDARKVAEARDCAKVIVFGLSVDGRHYCVTSYGRTRQLCREASVVADRIADLVLSGALRLSAAEGYGEGESS